MIPEIIQDRGIPTLYVNGEPYLALAGEVHNSSSNSLDYMESTVWPSLEGLGLNTLVLPVYWENVEPGEGDFTFELVDGLLAQARSRGMHLILLWFGLWKNAESAYAPAWVKQDSRRFFRSRKANGETLNTISPFCREAVELDARAFSRLMAHLREKDGEDTTVIMVQVENETGLLGTECDYCEQAAAAMEEEIPAKISELFSKKGSWKEAFGEDGPEYFMACQFASAVGYIAAAGRKEYPLPCFANAWLKQTPWYPGSYPSGGPVKGVRRIWKAMAPSLFTLAPDIYVPYVAQTMEEYSYPGNPLVVPELRKDAPAASYALYAFCGLHALCCSPFGVEDLGLPPQLVAAPSPELCRELKIDPAAFDMSGTKEALGSVYQAMEAMKPLYLRMRGTPHMQAYLKKTDTDTGCLLHFEKYDLEVSFFPKMTSVPISSGVVFELSDNRFLMGGMMSSFTFRPKYGVNKRIEFLKIERGSVENGEWKPTRQMNGDEKGAMIMGPAMTWFCVEVYQY